MKHRLFIQHKNTIANILGYICLTILVILLSIRLFTLRNNSTNQPIIVDSARMNQYNTLAEQVFGEYIPFSEFNMVGGNDSDTTHSVKDARLRLFILFTPNDCKECFLEIPLWNTLYEKYSPEIAVSGIISGIDATMAQQFILGQDIRIPMLFDEFELCFDKLGDQARSLTPLKLITTSDGAIIHASGTTYDIIIAQRDYLGLVQAVLQATLKQQ